MAVGAGMALLIAILLIAIVLGGIRHHRGRNFSDEIEEAAGMAPTPMSDLGRRDRRRARRRAAA